MVLLSRKKVGEGSYAFLEKGDEVPFEHMLATKDRYRLFRAALGSLFRGVGLMRQMIDRIM